MHEKNIRRDVNCCKGEDVTGREKRPKKMTQKWRRDNFDFEFANKKGYLPPQRCVTRRSDEELRESFPFFVLEAKKRTAGDDLLSRFRRMYGNNERETQTEKRKTFFACNISVNV